VKILLSVALAGLLGLALFTLLHSDVPFLRKAYSQIYIHGTPVCVTRHPQGIVAQVGECDMAGIPPRGEFPGDLPFRGHPRMDLPPGHPPIDGNRFSEENRRIPI